MNPPVDTRMDLKRNLITYIWHSLRCFQGIGWEYETELPEWSNMEWTDNSIVGMKTPVGEEEGSSDRPTTTDAATTTSTSSVTETVGVDCATNTTGSPNE